MKKIHKIAAAILSFAMVMLPATLTACTSKTVNSSESSSSEQGDVNVTGVTVTAANDATSLSVGATLQLAATVAPADATNKAVTWSSSDNAVATVSETGLVTGVAAGEVTITATTADGAKTDSVTLTVVEPVAVTGVTVDAADYVPSIGIGVTLQLSAAVAPENVADKSVTWSSENNDIATVDSNGVVTGVAAGKVKIRATSNADSAKFDELEVTVSAPIASGDSFKLKATDAERTDGEMGAIVVNGNTLGNVNANKGATLTFTFDVAEDCTAGMYLRLQFGPQTVTNIFEIAVNGDKIAVPSSYTVESDNWQPWAIWAEQWFANIALKEGENTIVFTVTGDCGNVDYLKLIGEGVERIVAVTGVEITSANNQDSIVVGETLQLTAAVAPATATNKAITWSSSDETKATVNEDGLVTGVAAGEVTITATTADGGKTDTFTVKVTIAVVDVATINVASVGNVSTVFKGETLQLTATVLPENATDKSVTWSSENNEIATVDGNGVVTGVASGTVKIKATAQDGSGIFGEFEVTVPTPIAAGDSFTIKGKDAAMTAGTAGAIGVGDTLGNINANEGATLTFTFDVAEACTAGLYLRLQFGPQTVENIFEVTVNDNKIAIPSKFTVESPDYAPWATWEEYWLANVALKEGENTIVFTVTGHCGNFDYMKLIGEGLERIVRVTGVEITSAGDKNSIVVGETLQLTAAVAPATATNKAITWSSSDETKATVSETGLVTGVAAGEVTITATTADGAKTDTFTVNITAESVKVATINVSSEDNVSTIYNDETLQLTATVLPENATDKSVTWSSENNEIATVSETGLVTGVASGTVKIKATARDGSGIVGEFEITVKHVERNALDISKAETNGSCWYNLGENNIGNLAAGDTITFKINSEKAQTADFIFDIAMLGDTQRVLANTFASVTVGETSLDLADIAVAPQGTDAYGWGKHGLAVVESVQLAAGENVIVITLATGVQSNFFGLTVVSEDPVTQIEKSVTPVDPPIADGTGYIFKGSEAVRTSGELSDINVGADGTLGNINENKGATLTYSVTATKDCTVGLYLKLAFGSKSVADIFTLTVNGVEVEITKTYTATSENFVAWATWEEYFLANIELKEGENIIVLTVTGGCGNYDYMKLVAEEGAIDVKGGTEDEAAGE